MSVWENVLGLDGGGLLEDGQHEDTEENRRSY